MEYAWVYLFFVYFVINGMSAVPNAMHELLKFIICMIWVKFIFQLSFSWLGWGQGIGKDHVIKFIWQQK